jgi:hypothetical protein
MASLRLRTEPTVHQVDVILGRIEAALHDVGARVQRGGRGQVRFRMPPPWRTRGGLLRLVSAGEVKVSAGWGEPRRLRYTLSFAALYALGAALTLGVVAAQWAGPRLALLRTVLVLWGLVLLVRVVVERRVRRMLASSAREIVERRADER